MYVLTFFRSAHFKITYTDFKSCGDFLFHDEKKFEEEFKVVCHV